MKIKKLVLENINSLFGRWEIDFTGEAFNSGLFAIMGPTGSGKTTILDAICLALFAQTPRIKGGSIFLSEVVSKGAGSCLAELTFEIDRRDYVASFGFGSYQRNGRNARKGELNPEKTVHTISCDGKILNDNGNRSAQNKIIEILGMNAEQFYRTVLLAQGKFDAFLSAGTERADVLEQITGTEIYSRIARKINEKSRELQHDVEKLEAEQTGYRLLPPDEEQAKSAECAELKKNAAEQLARKKQLDELLQIMDRISAAENEQRATAAKTDELARMKAAFIPDAARLAAGEKAARILPAFETFSEAEKRLREQSGELEQLRRQLPELIRQREECAGRTVLAGQQVRQRQEEQARLTGLIGRVSALDQEIRQTGRQLEEQERQFRDLQAARKELSGKRQGLQSGLRQLEIEREQAESCLASHPEDESLAENKAQWLEQMKNLQILADAVRKRKTECIQAENLLRRTEEKLRNQTELTARYQADLLRAQEELKQKREIIASILQGNTRGMLEQKAEILDRNLKILKLIPDYQEARSRLKKGQPCPLCGSPDHPYADEHRLVVSQDEADLEEVRSRLKNLTAAETEEKTASTAEIQAENRKQLAENDLSHLRETADGQKQELTRLTGLLMQERKQYEQTGNILKQQLAGHGFQWDGTGGLPEEIDRRIEDRRNAVRKLQGFDAVRAGQENELKNLDVRLGETDAASTQLQSQLKKGEAELNALKTERNVLFGNKDPQAEARTLLKHLEAARLEYDRLSQDKSRKEEAVRLGTERQTLLEKSVQEQKTTREEFRTAFLAACSAEQLTPEQFESARLSAGELAELTETRTRLCEREQTLAEQRKNLETALQELHARLPEGTERSETAAELARLETEVVEVQQKIGALTNELAENRAKRQDLAGLLERTEALRRKSETWQQLDQLAGGAKGQNFRRVAQQITLGWLLRAANATLGRMNGRYELLVSDSDDMLGIDVLDHLRGDEIRTSMNLSGGERFQVSLALALGLSSMSGEKIRIDSLFLDEGFGTLDPDSLGSALQTLSELRRTEGKTIGIISHVKAIGEAVPALIEVIPQGGGRSRLSGAGVSH